MGNVLIIRSQVESVVGAEIHSNCIQTNMSFPHYTYWSKALRPTHWIRYPDLLYVVIRRYVVTGYVIRLVDL